MKKVVVLLPAYSYVVSFSYPFLYGIFWGDGEKSVYLSLFADYGV